MRDFSKHMTIPSIQEVLNKEIEGTLISLSGAVPSPWTILGRGVRHAFAHPLGRFRVVEHLPLDGATAELEEMPIDPTLIEMIEADVEKFEWMSLAGPAEDFPLPGGEIDGAGLHRDGSHHAAFQAELGRHARASGMSHRLRDVMIVEEMANIMDTINDACVRLQVNPDVIRNMGDRWAEKFLTMLPSHSALAELKAVRHGNPSLVWAQHDYADLAMMSVSLAYCDVVVTERHWADVASRGHINSRFGTEVISDLAAVPAVLDRLVATS